MGSRFAVAAASATLALLLWSSLARAGCGQAFCTVDTRLSTAEQLGRGQVELDLSTEYIEQDDPWVGFNSARVGAIFRPDHAEVETTNLTWKLSAEFGLGERWSASVLLPIVHREHLHLEVEHAAGTGGHDDPPSATPPPGSIAIGDATGVPARWNFTGLGDVQLGARYSLLRPSQASPLALSLLLGLKLPTGRSDVRNGEGEPAEVTLQPGTGSVDAIVGAVARRSFAVPTLADAPATMPAFVGILARTPASEGRLGYRPGTEVLVNGGAAYPLTSRLSALGQVNLHYRDRDRPGRAPGVAREHTGSEQLYVSPGVHVVLTDAAALYSYVQVPVLQRTNGIQLVSRWNLLVGLTWRSR